MPKKIFRKQPPLDLLTKFLAAYGLKNTNDYTWFQKSCISIELLAELEPYYLPCLTQEYIHNPLRGITILRHILQAHSIKLHSMERTISGVKGVWYRLLYDSKGSDPPEIQVDFT